MPISTCRYVLGIYLTVRLFSVCVGTKTDIETPHKFTLKIINIQVISHHSAL